MEESQYLMWMNRKQILQSQLQAPILGSACNNNTNNSWEEKAFAEDANRILRGCIWPPRSYSCNFCKREFRSAQALGGHMNVHRKDRARLKQSLDPHNEEALDQFHHHKIDCKSLGRSQFSSEKYCSHSQLDCCLNSYSTLAINTVTTSKLLSSSPSSQENCCHPTMSPYNSSSISKPKGLINAGEEIFKGLGCNDYVETSLSVGLNSVFGQKSSIGSCGDEAISFKRPKTSFSSMPVFLKPCSNDMSAEFILGLKPGMEDLDLELRLGKPQKVK